MSSSFTSLTVRRAMSLVRLTSPARSSIVLSIGLFVPLVVASMHLYPGGTSWDPSSRGHDFWLNFLCDLLRPTALDGVANPTGSAVARAAMLVLDVGLLAFFHVVPRHFPTRVRTGRAVTWLGSMSAAAVPAVVFVSGDRFGVLHGVSVVVAAIPGLLAGSLAVVGLAQGEPRPKRLAWLGAATLAVSAVDFGLYVPQVLNDGAGPFAVAILERVALVLLLLWMLVVARRSYALPRIG